MVEAAAAYAKHVKSIGGREPEIKDDAEEDGEEEQNEEEEGEEMVTEAEGFQLHL